MVFDSLDHVTRLFAKWIDEFRRAGLGVAEPSLPLNAAFVTFCLALCTLFRWVISLIRPDTPFSIYLPAVLFATAFGGLRAGIVTTIGGALLGFSLTFLNTPAESALAVLCLIYLVIAGLMIWGIEHYRSVV